MNEKQIYILYKLIQLNEAGVDPYTHEEVLMEDRIDFVKNKYRGKLSTEHEHASDAAQDSDEIVDRLSQHDPSPKKVYTDWMVKQYQKKSFPQEDAYRVGAALDLFHKHKARLDVKDINQHTVDSLHAAVKGLHTAPATNRERSAQAEQLGRTHVWGDDKINIYRLENTDDGEKVSKEMYGGGHEAGGHHTSWCTAANSTDCRFKHYSKDSPLYVIHEKGQGDAPDKDRLFQYHVNTNQFMDKEDHEIGHADFNRIKDSLHKAWSEKPELWRDEPWEKTKASLTQ